MFKEKRDCRVAALLGLTELAEVAMIFRGCLKNVGFAGGGGWQVLLVKK